MENNQDKDTQVKMGKLQIHAEGRKYTTILPEWYRHRKVWKAPDPMEVRSIIPGSVLEIMVKEGEQVKKGQPLMVYEAMKMHNVITSPADGTVMKIYVKENVHLPKGELMLKLE